MASFIHQEIVVRVAANFVPFLPDIQLEPFIIHDTFPGARDRLGVSLQRG